VKFNERLKVKRKIRSNDSKELSSIAVGAVVQ
jgi:hypothetical protein